MDVSNPAVKEKLLNTAKRYKIEIIFKGKTSEGKTLIEVLDPTLRNLTSFRYRINDIFNLQMSEDEFMEDMDRVEISWR